jgi:hypothetical protein
MIAKWEPKQFIDSLKEFNEKWAGPSPRSQTFEDLQDELEEMLQEGDLATINREQRVILLAEEFDYEVLVTCEWLTEKYDVDIRCYRLSLAQHGDDLFLSCTSAYPPPELTDIAKRRRRKNETGGTPPIDWTEAKKKIQNEAITTFFDREIENGRPFDLKYRRLRFAIGDRQRFRVVARRQFARVWQVGRFDKDIEFWESRLGPEGKVEPISQGSALRFYLNTTDDVEKFKRAVETELSKVPFSRQADEDEQEADDTD